MSSVSSSSSSTNLAIAGLASGFDWQSLVSQLVTVERAPETLLAKQQAVLAQRKSALGSIQSELTTLQSDVTTLKTSGFFDSRTATPSDTTKASATAAAGTALGTYSFNVSQLASAAVIQGTADPSNTLSPTSDVSGLTLSSAGFATPVSAGTFTVNGAQVTVATSDTLQDVFDKISTATSGAVTGSYSAGSNDAISLTSSSAIVLGSSTDSSNFLSVAKLNNNNNTGVITSASKLGDVNVTGAMAQSNLATPVVDDGTGNGAFTINGVKIAFDASSDSVQNVLDRINNSSAGVVAAYNSVNNQFTLTNTTTGDVGMSLSDTAGNFLQATGLLGGALVSGNDLQFTVGGSSTKISTHSNTISGPVSGVTGLSVTPVTTGSFSVSVGSDTTTIGTAIKNFVTEYNKVQSVISAQTATTTDSTGKVTAGPLTGDAPTESLISQLRSLATSVLPGVSGSTQSLDALGFTSNGNDDSLMTSDTAGLDDALVNNLAGLKNLFTDSTNGIATQLASFLTATVGNTSTTGGSATGTLVTEENNLTKQSTEITTHISSIETQVLAYQERLTNEFIAMESATAKTNQQASYLTRAFSSTSSSG